MNIFFAGMGGRLEMKRAFRFLAILIALICLVSCGKGVSGGEPTAHAEAPLFSPLEGTYENAQSVSLLCGTEGASIHYTTDGTTPTTASPVYSAAITVNSSRTLKAISAKSGMADSAVASATYTITSATSYKAETPVFSPGGGTYNSYQEVTITTATPDAAIYYTTNGYTPTTSAMQYIGPISVTEDVTIRAIAVKSGMTDSDAASAAYNIDITLPKIETPAFSPPPGLYDDTQFVTIETATPEAQIHYTTNGTIPTSSSTLYNGPVEVLFNTTIKAVAVKDGWADSSVKSATYTIDNPPPVVENPVFTPDGGVYADDQLVTITTATPGATIHFTMDGTTPTEDSAVFSFPITVNTDTTIKAVATKFGWTDSELQEMVYDLENEPNPGETWTEPVTGIDFVWVPAGTFIMGDEFGGGYSDEKPTRLVTLSKGFWIGKYEVTQEQWEIVNSQNPSHHAFLPDAPIHPMENINWNKAREYITALKTMTGRNFRFPTEAEWEYAAKGGNMPGTKYSGTSDALLLDNYSWGTYNSEGVTHIVGEKLPNDFGIYDMSGNVWEWVNDWYQSDFYSVGPSVDPKGPVSGIYKIYRGGGCLDGNFDQRISLRWGNVPTKAFLDLGIRLVIGQ
ncbi:hypothetical protein EPN96_08630 [bacterium]|nr:MAG: hypothetical protein EPN96_08630 [bacterium]